MILVVALYLGYMRLTGERRAIAAAFLAMYGFLFLINALSVPDPGLVPLFGALAAIYALGFLGLVAGYFWARWFAIGLGLSGFLMGTLTMLQLGGIMGIFVFYALTHLAITAAMWGNGMSRSFDGRKEWRERFHLDESATNRLGKSVIRVGVSLPYIVLFALAPREGAGLALVGGGMVVAGAWALTKMRSWSIPALAAGAVTMLIATIDAPSAVVLSGDVGINLDLVALGAIGFTTAALAPFVTPVVRFLRSEKA